MSTHPIPRFERDAMLWHMVPERVAIPSDSSVSDQAITFVFTPDLTAEQTTMLGHVVAYCRQGFALTFDEYVSIADDLAALRTFRQQTQAQFMALTATQRDRALFDAINAQTNVLRALLRD